ncbi:MAG: carbamoyltransferase HypF [candidate division Zixibacteria bacterium]|nr:carbamoyltransferase HypF [candidate division Zixibacteria bacterium]
MPGVRIEIRGIVQGVGFRPFIYNLARKFGLKGYVLNDTDGVEIEAEGGKIDLDRFLSGIRRAAPSQSKIVEMKTLKIASQGFRDFTIRESKKKETRTVLVSPDLATCPDCLNELFNPEDRRFNYPFLNCTNCGPRLTIIQDTPYDREKTTMSAFKMCADCNQEYHNPQNRRFHAQPNACPVCGPRLTLTDNQGNRLSTTDHILTTIGLLKKGYIIAIKGIGGYHLACDAMNKKAVSVLRKRKYREDKPFALMAKDLKTIRRFCHLNPSEIELLRSVQRPIVLLKKKKVNLIAPEVAPLQKNFGVMLPYSPLHHLLLKDSNLILVMTSGNQSDEPIAYEDKEAFERLKKIADYFLFHNREIHRRCDDSVTRVFRGEEMNLRRGRGYVPLPLKVDLHFRKHILAAGAQLKNTFCLARDSFAFPSTHIGDLENYETLDFYSKEIERFKKLCSVKPEVVTYDMHPEYLSTKYALSLQNIRKIPVQHHYAHIASCMAENKISQKVIGVAFDGTGYGEDENIWGGEFLLADLQGFQRIAHFKYVPMPGGEAAIKNPWMMAVSYLYACYGEDFLNLNLEFVRKIDFSRWEIIRKMLDQKVNLFLTSSAGRLFDSVSVLLNFREKTNYEGQPAIELEFWAEENIKGKYDYEIIKENDLYLIRPDLIIKGVVNDLIKKQRKSKISARFHNTIAQIINEVCSRLRKEYDLNSICLSGGVFQNMLLLSRTYALLNKNKFRVYTHHLVPPNDGGISLGQAIIANQRV